MLKEKIFYRESLPVNIVTANVQEYPIHFHDDLEVVFVLNGSVFLKNGYYNYTLKQGDIFILNDREIHSFTSTGEENMVMMLQLEMNYFSKYYDNFKNCFFVTDMDDEDESMDSLRTLLSRIMMETIEKGNNFEEKIIESVHNLIGILMAEFQYFSMEDGKFVNETKNKGNKILAGRLNRITDYLYENYSRRLTLNEVAEKEHLSIFYLSHVIKTATGLSFQELLSFIRVEESERLLLGTNKKIGAISEETGFSAVRYYIKYFTKWFGMPPAEYRAQYTGKVSSREILAKYVLSPPEKIVEIIKEKSKDVYDYFSHEEKPEISILDLDLSERTEGLTVKDCALRMLLKADNMKPASLAFKMFKDLNEEVILMTENCVISQELHKVGQGQRGLSILVFNSNEELKALGESGSSLEDTLDSLKNMTHRLEVLIRISGIGGKCRISRYKLFKENIIMGYRAKMGLVDIKDKRDLMLDRWGSNPQVTSESTTISDNLSVQSNLEGFSMELILIDTVFE